MTFPSVVVLDDRGCLVHETRGYGRDTIDEIERAISRYGGEKCVKVAPLALRTLQGEPYRLLESSSARFTIVEFWVVWCKPCPALARELIGLAAKRPEGEVEVVQVNCDKYVSSARSPHGGGERGGEARKAVQASQAASE